ncbi:hypothetical protein JG688_00016494 [Phytophthora aleatoria]|uniref:Polynucleotide adenylyltransferase n=1 Tax=Phytophthora aleatoria TaxID=2496075 RepID=A0A8J5IFP0_9STRA|nr:hypothetical protein JG688_00016494 [Phytophthora aleatoria]
MVMRHDNSKQQAPAPLVTRAFSFKDAVVRSPPKSVSLVPKDQPVQPSPRAKNDKKSQQTPGSRQIRSRSITKIVESPSFKKRCEALKSHPGRKHHDPKGENASSPASSPRANQKTKKLTPLEELCEREKLLHNSSDSFKARKRATRSTSSCSASSSPLCEANSSSEKDDGSSPGISDLSHDLAVNCSTGSRSHSRKVFDSDDDFLDCDDTNSESTTESSCPSPRHSPLSRFNNSHRRSDLSEMEVCQKPDELSSMLSNCDEEDEEAYMLLDRIHNLSAEFVANREYEESNALSWSVQHAAQQGVISAQLQQNLFSNICEGYLDEARDVLYHKCHLIPAVGSVVESPMQPIMDPGALQSFVAYVDGISPADAVEARMHKLQVLKQLSDLLTKWVKMVGRERDLSEEHIALTKGSLFLAGSYRLGLDDPNSDIDAVCVAPWHVTHDDFFGSFCRLLEQTPGVSHLAPVPSAYVPLISLSFLGVRMDLLFARLPVSSVESNQNIDSDHMLVGVHETSMKALNAPLQVSQPTFSVIYEELWRARYMAEIAVGISKPFPTAAPSPEESSESDLKAAVVCMATSMPSFDQPLNAVQSREDDLEGIQALGEAGAWDKLFQSSNFFIRYGSYMVFNFQADTESAMHKWGKFVQSRLRKLVDNLHHMSPVSRVHAFPCYFPHTCDSEREGPGSCMFIGIEFHCRRHQTIQPKDDPEVKKTLEQTIRFFLATDLQQMEDKQPDMTADAKVMSWEELPDFVFRSGRSSADLERAKYTDDLEKMGFSQGNTPSFRPPYYVNSYNRNGKWRSGSGPRKYAGGQRKYRRDFRNAPRSYPGTQAG